MNILDGMAWLVHKEGFRQKNSLYRLATRMNQKEMAEKSGVSLPIISYFEQGVNQKMTLNNFISLLRVIGME